MNDLAEFARLVEALAPWRHQLVFVGGWAHRLYRQHPSASVPGYAPLATRDADVAFKTWETFTGSIQRALLDAGFTEHLTGDYRPPVARYSLGHESIGFYAEFLTPLVGSGTRRNGDPDATLQTAGITAQRLRYLELLLMRPWQVALPERSTPGNQPPTVWIANPTSFVIQKILIRRKRSPQKRAQDILYIHDTLELFAGELATLSGLWTDAVAPEMTKRLRRDVSDGVTELFSSLTDPLRDAARIPQDRYLDPERMRAFCDAAMRQVLDAEVRE